MTHDKNGNELQIGDKVGLEFIVKRLIPEAEVCNVDVQSVEQVYAGHGIFMSLKSGACILLEKAGTVSLEIDKPVDESGVNTETTGDSNDTPGICNLCGKPMPPGEEMFKYHGYSGPCPTDVNNDNNSSMEDRLEALKNKESEK